MLEAEDIVFSYTKGQKPVLRPCKPFCRAGRTGRNPWPERIWKNHADEDIGRLSEA